jgi:hypothetical protein
MRTKPTTALAAIALALAFLYMWTYAVLSINGRYEPAAIGLRGVKWYAWAPCGFYDQDCGWNRSMMTFFVPLMFVDTRLWHTPDDALSGKYPITEVDPEDIWEYYEKWGLTTAVNPSDSGGD